MNEDAQMALEVISQELRRSGYNPIRAGGAFNDLSQGSWTLFACDTGFVDTTLANVSALTCNGAGTNAALAVVYEGDDVSGKKTTTGKLMDCIGNGVTAVAGQTYYVMQARIYVANNALNCRGSGDWTQTQVLAENIESMTLLFGVADPLVVPPAPKRMLGYLTANELSTRNDGNLNTLTAVQRWNSVVAAKVCVIVRSEENVLGDLRDGVTNPTYTDCNGASVDILDGRLRRAYRTTVLLRNHGVGYADS
jgi:type IV pilus assembly protein PilW